MSRFGIVPVFDVKQLGSSDHDAKNCLLTALQEAIKQVQNVAEPAGTGALTEDTPEACWLCEHLDRVLLYGLQEPQWGYWPWVRKFTHPAAQQEIASLPSVSTDLGYGRAWLLASLNGGLLESYMLSFRQNLRLLRKGYSSNSLLRDPQYLDLLATLLSGLEHIPFSLNQNNALLDDTNAWPKIISYRQSLLHTDEDVVVLPQGVSVMTISSTDSSTSSREDDSGIQSVRVSCATLSSLASPAEEVHVPETCGCAECAAFLDREHIRRIINLDVVPPSSADSSEAADLELEVTRVVITRRKGGGHSTAKPRTLLSTFGSEAVTTVILEAGEATNVDGKVCAPLRRALVGAEGQSVDSSQGAPFSEKGRTGVACFAAMTESTGSMRDSGCYAFVESDRGAPDGCEEEVDEVRQEGRTTDDSEQHEDVFSIYDCSGKCTSDVTCDDSGDNGSATEGEAVESSKFVEQELLVETSKKEGFDIKVENNALLHLTLEIFESDDEKFYKMFLAWKCCDGKGLLEPIYVLMTNKFLYILRPRAEVNLFARDFSVRLIEVKVVTVWLNYQGFSLTCNSGKKADVATGHAELTRNILSSLDLAVRRTHNGVKCLPSIVSHCSEQLDAMKKLLAHELKAQEDGGLVVKDYRLVHWEKCIQSSPGDYACGPSVGSPLMWRFLEGNARRERKKHWEAGYFLLRAGVLYRFSNQGDTIPSATYLVSGVHCGSCQAVSNVGRPHALQLNLAPSGGACLQLAASNEAEMERWVHALTEAGQASFCGSGSMGGMVACCLVLVGDLVLTLVEGSRVLGVGVIIDLSVVRSENNFCIMEFDGGEAESCAYNWIFWFATEEEKNEFLSIVSVSWQEMFKVPLEVAPMSSGTLRRHCLERASQLEARLNDSRAFCLDI
ncbi:pleckstrin homology domain-containing family M member 2-like isoform X2 [Dermacentor albipictus]|uniref:pleckstrin homology domain-containing family M member 2-like isoform X2 n=1 Tax=Dermacentor albipictus TaxID=60249 RepID=UPI0031FC8345